MPSLEERALADPTGLPLLAALVASGADRSSPTSPTRLPVGQCATFNGQLLPVLLVRCLYPSAWREVQVREMYPTKARENVYASLDD